MHTYTNTQTASVRCCKPRRRLATTTLGVHDQGRGELVSGVVSARGTKPGSGTKPGLGSDRVSPIRRTARNPVWTDKLDSFKRN